MVMAKIKLHCILKLKLTEHMSFIYSYKWEILWAKMEDHSFKTDCPLLYGHLSSWTLLFSVDTFCILL